MGDIANLALGQSGHGARADWRDCCVRGEDSMNSPEGMIRIREARDGAVRALRARDRGYRTTVASFHLS